MRLLLWGALLAMGCSCAELKDVKSVYLFPMAGGLDQHLAHRLTLNHTFRVVSDPKLADAIFTDQLSGQFEYRIEHIKKDPVPPAAVPPAGALSGTNTETEPHASSFSRGRGTVFLVDAKSRQVLWSDYRRLEGSNPHGLERTAKLMAGNISKMLNPAPVSQK